MPVLMFPLFITFISHFHLGMFCKGQDGDLENLLPDVCNEGCWFCWLAICHSGQSLMPVIFLWFWIFQIVLCDTARFGFVTSSNTTAAVLLIQIWYFLIKVLCVEICIVAIILGDKVFKLRIVFQLYGQQCSSCRKCGFRKPRHGGKCVV